MQATLASSSTSTTIRDYVNTVQVFCMKVVQSCLSLCDPMDYYSPWNSPGQNTGVRSPSLLQRIFAAQELSWGLLHWQVDSLPLNHLGRPECKGYTGE